ncbi:MAG: DUF1080 domain-containing protein [Verrucomicrobiota bacterium]
MNGFLPLLVSLSLIAGALAESPSEPSPGEAKEGIDFISMFNGENLEGWEGKPGAWIVRDGEIWCTGESKEKNWLIWRSQEPGNFTLRLEFLWEKGNSGVQVRSDDLGDWQVFGYQVEVARREVMGLWHHSLLPKDHPKREARHLMSTAGESAMIDPEGKRTNKVKQDAEDVQARYEEGQWNSMEIVAKGDTLTQSINGVLFAELTDRDEELSRKKGWIALQDHGKGCRVAFRNLRIQIED